MRICLDARFLTESGSSSYIRQLVPEILRLDPANEYFILKYPNQRFDFEPQLKGEIICPVAVGLLYLLWTIFIMPFRLRAERIDVYHAMKLPGPYKTFSKQKVVTTIHSITGKYKGYFPRELKMQLFHRYADPALKQSAAVIAVSQFLRDYVIDHMKMPADRLHVIYHGIDGKFHPRDLAAVHSIQDKYGTGRAYFLCVGNVFPVKNHETAVRAFAAVAHRYSGNLVIAGDRRNDHFLVVEKIVGEFGLTDRVKFIGFVAPDDLSAIMTGARALVMPSLTEGFGLALLEAFRCGTPAIATSIGSLTELGEGLAYLIDDPRDHAGFARAMNDLLDLGEREKDLRRRCLDHAAQFTWEASAKAHIALYRSVAGNPA